MKIITVKSTRLVNIDTIISRAKGNILDLRAKIISLSRQVNKDFDLIKFSESTINKTVFVKCTFEDCSFNGTNFRDCTFEDCSFKDCTFIGANFVEIKESRENTFINCDFRVSYFSQSYMFRTTFFNCDFRTATIEKSNFRQSLLPKEFDCKETLTEGSTFSNEFNENPLNF